MEEKDLIELIKKQKETTELFIKNDKDLRKIIDIHSVALGLISFFIIIIILILLFG